MTVAGQLDRHVLLVIDRESSVGRQSARDSGGAVRPTCAIGYRSGVPVGRQSARAEGDRQIFKRRLLSANIIQNVS